MHREITHSTWNWKRGKYDYFAVNGPIGYRQRLGYPASRSIKGVGDLPEESVQPLPVGAQYIGSGDQAIGIVSSPTKRSGLVFVVVTVIGLCLLSWVD